MLVPSLFTNDVFDDFDRFFDFDYPQVDRKLYGKRAGHVMKTDVREQEDKYEVVIDLPGFKKEEIKVELKEGYLTVSAGKSLEEGDKNQEGKYIRRERYVGNMSRSFFVGKDVTKEDIHAKFEDGVLTLDFPKEAPKKVEETHYITIG
ncbi:MAG: Hsp20/alpha crystallin family protein [Lachnospiraceae bacterium]|jgi:HSP20 family molecular chaperone IbpA|nr:Hsp20/alpha crystallin family protein [Lachnospiraceae bacterium]MEE1109749.1 Hsp20/alpha crystallin family protein [Lachnospiraceae bacterium]